jgi:hypothetical protein
MSDEREIIGSVTYRKETWSLTFTRPPGALKKEVKGVAKEVLPEVLQYWAKNFLPKHFTQSGSSEYGYQKRSSFTDLKKTKYGTAGIPMVKTGRLRDAMLSQAARVKTSGYNLKKEDPSNQPGNSGMAKVTFRFSNLPNYVRLLGTGKAHKKLGPAKRSELTRTSQVEANQLAEMLNTKILERFQQD